MKKRATTFDIKIERNPHGGFNYETNIAGGGFEPDQKRLAETIAMIVHTYVGDIANKP